MNAWVHGRIAFVVLLASVGGVLSVDAAERKGRLRERIRERIQERRGAAQAGRQVASTSPGDSQGSIMVDQRQRTYLVHLPTGYTPATRYPLLLVFHGGRGAGAKIAKQTGFGGYADREGFIAVFPDGIEHNWNDGRGTTDAERLGVDDVKFVRMLTAHLQQALSIDPARIYATGVSNGGIFAHRLGCELADVLAGIGPVIGAMPSRLMSACRPAEPISIMAIQGDADPFIPIHGGEEGWQSGLGDGGLLESAESTRVFWARKNDCSDPPDVIQIPPTVQDGTRVTTSTYARCANGVEVQYHVVEGMGHVWPPKPAQAPRISGPSSQNLNASEVIWEFFKSHPKRPGAP